MLKVNSVEREIGTEPQPVPIPGCRVTVRAISLSLLLILGICWWIAYSEVRTAMTEITCTSLPIGVIFALFVVCILNAWVKRCWPARALAPGELATIYILVAIGSSVAGIGMVGFMTPALANPLWYTNDKWSKFAEAVPRWWAPRDMAAIRDYYLGNSTLYTWVHIRAWLPPVLVWCGFLLLLMFMTLCFAAILRKQWIEHERLSFPITYVPIAMVYSPGGLGGFFQSRALRIGFLIPVILQSMNSLSWLYPSLPFIPLKPIVNGPLDLGTLFTNVPWNAIGTLPLAFHPNTIGLSYLLETDVSFSCWFFHLFRKALEVWSVAAGYRMGSASSPFAQMPFTKEQGVGAWLCLAALTLWTARQHLASVWQQAIRGGDSPSERKEGMSSRLAVFGAGAAFAAAVGLAWVARLPLLAAVLMFVFFAAFMLALMRIRAEVGTAWHFGPSIAAPEMVVRVIGPMNLSLPALSVLAYHTWYNLDYRSFTPPHFIEGYRIAEQGRLRNRQLTVAMVIALVFGLFAASWSVLHLYYIYGASTAHVNSYRIMMGRRPYQTAAGHLGETHTGPDVPGLAAVGVGALMLLVLHIARARFLGWPFHPAGYAIANTYITDLLWFPFFLGWLAKWLTLRYGGLSAYKRALPFFIGLILGDYVIASLWTLVGIALGVDMYRCFPN
jgi:hypothetical protein